MAKKKVAKKAIPAVSVKKGKPAAKAKKAGPAKKVSTAPEPRKAQGISDKELLDEVDAVADGTELGDSEPLNEDELDDGDDDNYF
jgi:hypothetical protein